MTLKNINQVEKNIRVKYAKILREMTAINNIKRMLKRVDHKIEHVSGENELVELLAAAKDRPLNRAEKDIISRIINSKSERHERKSAC